jgi:hypothetical protein
VGNNPVNANDPSGLDTQIQIGFTEVTPEFGPIPSTHHQFTILTDTETGDQFAIRGGPTAQSFGEFVTIGGSGPIHVETSAFNEDFRDFRPGQPIQNIGIISRDFADSVANANEFRDVTNVTGIPYSLLGPNSNSVNTTFVESLTGSRPQSDLLAPGNGSVTPSPGLSFGPSSFVTGGGASGGFVLYPSKPNTNSLQNAYRK